MVKVKNEIRICVLIPAYNEAAVIGGVIKNVKKAFQKKNYITDVVVVNDGSSDNTSSEARMAGAIVIDHILNSGAGGATATGLRYAKINKHDVVVTIDADGQHDPKDAVAGVDILLDKNVDLLIGSRLINSEGMSLTKIVGNKGLSIITFLLFGINSSDSQSGLRVYSRKAIEQLYWRSDRYEFCSEMLWRAKQLNLRVNEYPIKAIYTVYSKAKGQNNWNAINIVKSLLKRRISELLG